MSPNRKNPSYKFQKTWAWPSNIEAAIQKQVEGYSLHVCSGESTLGDVKLDLFKRATVKGSMFDLPFRRETFDTVICDPPWELAYDKRTRLLYNLRDVLKPNGKLIFNAFWFPKIRGLEIQKNRCPTCGVDQSIIVGIPNATWRNVSLLTIARRSALSSETETP